MKVITLSQEKFKDDCIQLGLMFQDLDFIAIVGIRTGGYEVAKNIHHALMSSTPLYSVDAKRNSTGRKQTLHLKSLARLMPITVNNLLRILEHKSRLKHFNRTKTESRSVILSENLISFLSGKTGNIVLIDDAVDTGYSVSAVLTELSTLPNIKVKVGVVVQTFENPLIVPDYKLYSGVLIRFPWSMDYK